MAAGRVLGTSSDTVGFANGGSSGKLWMETLFTNCIYGGNSEVESSTKSKFDSSSQSPRVNTAYVP